MAEVATRALKAVWFQKWFVHRRLRPEAFGGRVHNRLAHAVSYPIHSDVLNSAAPAQVFGRYGTYLLPQAFPEGSPLHPSYGAGHATVAGACVTMLKALFDGVVCDSASSDSHAGRARSDSTPEAPDWGRVEQAGIQRLRP